MTVSEGEVKDAVHSRDTSVATRFERPIQDRSTATHAVPVIIPAERSLTVRYAVAVAAPVLALAVTLPIAPALARAILVLFWPAVIGTAWFAGVGPGIVASFLSIALANYFLIGTPGELTFAPENLIPLGVFLFASTSVALLTDATRTARRNAARAAAQNAELAYELEMQAIELEQQLEESQSLSEENARLHREALSARTGAERSARIADRLFALTARLSAAATPSAVAEAALAEARTTFGAECGRLSLIQDDGNTAQLLAQFGYPDDPRWHTYSLSDVGPPREAVHTGHGVFIESNADARERFPAEAKALSDAGVETAVVLPIADGRVIALMSLSWSTVRALPSDERELMELFASQCAQALGRAIATESEHRARESAEEANRAKTQFLATMSHELRTPLNAISGYAELLSLGLRGPTTPAQQEDLARIMRSQRHLLSIINDILNFARLEAGQLEYHVTDIPLPMLLGELESLIGPQLVAKRLEFTCEPVGNGVVVRADSEKVRQVLLNLLANAVKFTPAGGTIRVSSAHDDRRVHIRVADTGIGIPLDRRGAIFEPFVQLHRTLAQPAEGTGLGLAISRDLARGMGGELSVESDAGLGSTFTLTLPRAETQS